MGNERYILFGAGREGVKALDILSDHGMVILCFCDNGDKGDRINGIPVISPNELNLYYTDDVLVLITPKSRSWIIQIKTQLLQMGIRYELFEDFLRIYILSKTKLSNTCYKDKVIVIGDSHASFFGGYESLHWMPTDIGDDLSVNLAGDLIANFHSVHLRGALAFHLTKYDTTTKVREKIERLLRIGILPAGRTVMCCFGEIDIRKYILPQAHKQNKDIFMIVDQILSQYTKFLAWLSQDHVIWVWAVLPVKRDSVYLEGTEQEINHITEYFNSKLFDICTSMGFQFFSIFHSLIDENYMTKTAYYLPDGFHLSQKAWLFAFDEFNKQGVDINFGEGWYSDGFHLTQKAWLAALQEFKSQRKEAIFEKVFGDCW